MVKRKSFSILCCLMTKASQLPNRNEPSETVFLKVKERRPFPEMEWLFAHQSARRLFHELTWLSMVGWHHSQKYHSCLNVSTLVCLVSWLPQGLRSLIKAVGSYQSVRQLPWKPLSFSSNNDATTEIISEDISFSSLHIWSCGTKGYLAKARGCHAIIGWKIQNQRKKPFQRHVPPSLFL